MLTYFHKQQSKSKLDSTKIKQLPHFVSPQKISQLNFSHNGIRSIPPHIKSLFNLQIIDLSHNKINQIEHIFHIPQLKFLNISHNLITYIPQDISLLDQLQNLDLSYNKITLINNIKILKEFVQMRMIIKQGFVEINLQGNEVLKKKGCRQKYQKWMNPSYSQCNRYSQAKIVVKENEINLTKKRDSKSLEYNHTFRNHNNNSVLQQTHRTFKIPLHPKEQKSISHFGHYPTKNQAQNNRLESTQKIKVNIIKSQQFSHEKQKTEIPLMPANSQMLRTQLGMNNLSETSQDMSLHEVVNLGQWFCLCIDKLHDLRQGFMLMSENQDISSLQIQVRQKLVEQCLYARQLVNISVNIIQLVMDNNLTRPVFQQYLAETEIINLKIKKYHHDILQRFKEKDYLPIKFYKPWVVYVKKLKQIIQLLPLKITLHQAHQARQQEIKELSSISPEKDIANHSHSVHEIFSNKKKSLGQGNKRKLSDLLFSKNKDELLLSIEQPHNSSQQKVKAEMKEDEECDYCLMLKWQNNKHKQQLVMLQERVTVLEKEKEGNMETIEVLQRFKEKYLNLTCKQELIIEQLQGIRPSTYQNILLEQAKTIQYMLNSDVVMSLSSKNKAIGYVGQRQALQSFNSRQIQKNKLGYSNTNISSHFNNDKNRKENAVSEFSIGSKKDFITKESNHGSSYFKNKNIVTTVNKTGDQPKSKSITAQGKRDDDYGDNRQQIIVSQFNSQGHQHISQFQSGSKDKDKAKHKKSIVHEIAAQNTDKNSMHYSINSINSDLLKHPVMPKLQITQNDKILISQSSQNKTKDYMHAKMNHKEQQLKSQLLSKLLAAKLNTEKSAISKKNSQNSRQNNRSRHKLDKSSFVNSSGHRNLSSYQSKENNHSQNISQLNFKNKSYEFINQRSNYHQSCTYKPMQSSQADNYKKYMRYHLRNNIIQVLTKKNNYLPGSNQYKYLTKSQRLIHKQNHQNQATLIQQSERLSSRKTLR